MANDPVEESGFYWTEELFRYGELPEYPITILSVDPSTGDGDDSSGIVVASRAPGPAIRYYIRYAQAHKLPPHELMKLLSRLIVRFHPRLLVLETSLGHSLWKPHIATLPPIRVEENKPSLGKELRAAQALGLYESHPGQVFHVPILRSSEFEQQLLAFPPPRSTTAWSTPLARPSSTSSRLTTSARRDPSARVSSATSGIRPHAAPRHHHFRRLGVHHHFQRLGGDTSGSRSDSASQVMKMVLIRPAGVLVANQQTTP
jgi:hypothetical protein